MNVEGLTGGQEYLQLLRMGDILHFAAIALVVLYAVYQLKHYYIWSCVIAAIIMMISPMVWDTHDHYILQLFTGQPPRIFFPVFPWLVYPLIGLTIGHFLKASERQTFNGCKIAGLLLVIIGWCWISVDDHRSELGFYRTYPGETLLHVAVVLLALWCWHLLSPRIAHTEFFKLLAFCSRHITVIYLVQWILICWLLPFTGYQTMNTLQSIMMAAYTSTVTFAITYFITKRKYNEFRKNS